jgi:hypothetical protein
VSRAPDPINPPISPLLRASDVAKWLVTTESNVYLLARNGVLPSVRFKTGTFKKKDRDTVRFTRESVERFIREHTCGNGGDQWRE